MTTRAAKRKAAQTLPDTCPVCGAACRLRPVGFLHHSAEPGHPVSGKATPIQWVTSCCEMLVGLGKPTPWKKPVSP